VAAPSWWAPFQYQGYEPAGMPYELLNWLIPYMAAPEQAEVARYLWNVEQSTPGTLPSGVPSAYGTAQGSAASTNQWLAGLTNLTTPGRGTPGENWFTSLAGLRPTQGMTRQQQREWSQNYQSALQTAPDEFARSAAEYVFNPTLLAPEYGQAAAMGRYLTPYRTKGGLVGNPWFV